MKSSSQKFFHFTFYQKVLDDDTISYHFYLMSSPIYIEAQNGTIESVPRNFLQIRFSQTTSTSQQYLEEEEENNENANPFIADEEEENLEQNKVKQNIFPNYFVPEISENDLEIRQDLILIPPSDIINLFNLFLPTTENFNKILKYSLNGPYKHSVLKPILLEWFNAQNSEFIDSAFSQSNRKSQRNNIWFFKIINHLSVPQKNYILEQYCNNTVNPLCKIEGKDIFSFSDLRKKNYIKSTGTGIRVGEFISDLKRVAAQIESRQKKPYILKMYTEGSRKPQIQYFTKSEFVEKLKSIKFFASLTGYSIYSAGMNPNYFLYKSICFLSPDPDIFSIFQGYDYPLVSSISQPLIQPFIDHIHQIICSGDSQLAIYIINWLSFVFQKPNEQTETALILIGPHGSGKTTFTNVICELLGDFARKNTSIQAVSGNFNDTILNKKLIICNETNSFVENKKSDFEKIKTLITDNIQEITKRYQNTQSVQIYANFIFVSNNIAPVLIQEGDRRFVVSEVSSAKVNNLEYFRDLKSSFTEEFYSHLLSYFLRNDISRWERRNLPMTKAKKRILDYSRNPISLFVQSRKSKFEGGYQASTAYEAYRKWCTKNGYKAKDIQNFEIIVSVFCDILDYQGTKYYRLKTNQ